jgi:hypothetical protein
MPIPVPTELAVSAPEPAVEPELAPEVEVEPEPALAPAPPAPTLFGPAAPLPPSAFELQPTARARVNASFRVAERGLKGMLRVCC